MSFLNLVSVSVLWKDWGEDREQKSNASGNSISGGIAYSVPRPGHDYFFSMVVSSI